MPRFTPKGPNFLTRFPDPDSKPLVDALNSMQESIPRGIIGTFPIRVEVFGDRYIISLVENNSIQPNRVQTFVVYEELDDCLKCVLYDQDPFQVQKHDPDLGKVSNPTSVQRDTTQQIADLELTGDQTPARCFVYVAKARLLQRTPFDAKTVRLRGLDVTYVYSNEEKGARTATSSDSEATPEYQLITPPYFIGDIIAARSAVTGYSFSDPDIDVGVDAAFVAWEDLNTGGRQWATDPNGPPT